jgi:hypothetical protein
MTDFVFDSYKKRCWKERRKYFEYKIKNNKTENEMINSVETKDFLLCYYKPLVTKELKEPLLNCLKKNQYDYSKCKITFTNFLKKGNFEINEKLNL